ncbi:hypothetical protein, partial [Escherichia coli]|uniref:hypothetical protein n=1 Tax=Escherichia coli TaxID=562 RepID=UPI0021C586D7
ADRNRSHWSTSKTPSYTKSVSWQHHLFSGFMQKLLSNYVIVRNHCHENAIPPADIETGCVSRAPVRLC